MMPWSPAPSSLFRAGIDALRDVRRLAVEVVLEAGGLPVEALLLVTDPLHRVAHDLLDLVARAGRPAVRVLEPLLVDRPPAADFAADDDPLGRDQGLAGDARFGILGQEKSTMASLIWSATLSGWPSDTDSDVKR